jgi:activator of HSP90 ATPase
LRNRYTTKDAAPSAILATTTTSTSATTTQHVPNPARDNSTRANANQTRNADSNAGKLTAGILRRVNVWI